MTSMTGKKGKGLLIIVKYVLLICLTLLWVLISYQGLHLQCCDTIFKDQPHELQVKKYIVYTSDNQACFLVIFFCMHAGNCL